MTDATEETGENPIILDDPLDMATAAGDGSLTDLPVAEFDPNDDTEDDDEDPADDEPVTPPDDGTDDADPADSHVDEDDPPMEAEPDDPPSAVTP